MAQWVKDPAQLQLWCKLQLWLGFSPWPGNFHMPWVWLPPQKMLNMLREVKDVTKIQGAIMEKRNKPILILYK